MFVGMEIVQAVCEFCVYCFLSSKPRALNLFMLDLIHVQADLPAGLEISRGLRV